MNKFAELMETGIDPNPPTNVEPNSPKELVGVTAHESCRERCHIGRHFAVWDFAKAIWETNGHRPVRLSKTTSAKFCGLKRSAFTLSRDWLVAHGWLEELRKPEWGTGRAGGGLYRPISHDEWTVTRGMKFCVQRRYNRDDEGMG
jgi:hypothetical protein